MLIEFSARQDMMGEREKKEKEKEIMFFSSNQLQIKSYNDRWFSLLCMTRRAEGRLISMDICISGNLWSIT